MKNTTKNRMKNTTKNKQRRRQKIKSRKNKIKVDDNKLRIYSTELIVKLIWFVSDAITMSLFLFL